MSGVLYRLSLMLFVGALCFSFSVPVSAQKVGSPEWKREFERKKAEFKRKHDAARAKIRHDISTTSSRTKTSTNRSSPSRNVTRTKKPVKSTFHAAQAPSPVACLKEFRIVAKRATSTKSLLPYLSEMQRSHIEISEQRGSKFDHLKHDRDLLSSIVRFDDVRIKGDVAYVDVVRYTGGYNTGTFTMKGEGTKWRMHEYKDKMMYNYMPPEPRQK